MVDDEAAGTRGEVAVVDKVRRVGRGVTAVVDVAW